jgi:Gas vesicle synthesis protein GvpL/GvpF
VAEPRAVWVYAIAQRVAVERLGQLAGVGWGPLRTVAAAGLTAVAEDVDRAEFGEEALRRHLEDLAWLEAAARAHHRVIDAVAQQGPVVPMRLATVYSSDARVAAMLTERSTDLRGAMGRISGRKEWGVKAWAARQPVSGGATSDSRTGSARPGTGAGAAYLQRRRDQLSASKNARREALASAEAVHAALVRHAVATRLHQPQAPQLAGSQALMILNASYLVDDAHGENFAAAIAALAEQHRRVRLELTGPWPAYSFADTGEDSQG